MQKVKLLLVGIGGYAGTYLNPLLNGNFQNCEIAGCVDPFPQACPRIGELNDLGVKIYSDMEKFFEDGNKADLCVISSPIHFHTTQIVTALKNGCQVLCEKPLCGDINDVNPLLYAEKEYGKYVSIGYQWSYSDAIQGLKRDILDGAFGKPVFLKTIVLWPRNKEYYTRGAGWAGKLRAKDGSLILDSVANNATAHYLHNIFYVLGDTVSTSAIPTDINAELYRANEIENYDTCKLTASFENGAKMLYIASHATETNCEPVFEYKFTNGTIYYNATGETPNIIGVFADGTKKDYGNPFDNHLNKFKQAVESVLNPELKPLCGIKAASVHTSVISKAQEFGIKDFPADKVKEKADGSAYYVEGLYEELMKAYNEA